MPASLLSSRCFSQQTVDLSSCLSWAYQVHQVWSPPSAPPIHFHGALPTSACSSAPCPASVHPTSRPPAWTVTGTHASLCPQHHPHRCHLSLSSACQGPSSEMGLLSPGSVVLPISNASAWQHRWSLPQLRPGHSPSFAMPAHSVPSVPSIFCRYDKPRTIPQQHASQALDMDGLKDRKSVV